MEKSDLATVIIKHIDDLENKIQNLNLDLEYNKELKELNKKHNVNTMEQERKITEIETMINTLETVKEDFEEEIDYQDLDVEEIKECAER